MKLLADADATFVAGGWNNYDNPLNPPDWMAPRPRPGEEQYPPVDGGFAKIPS